MTAEWEQYANDVQRIAIPGGHLYRAGSWVELPSGIGEPNRGYYHWSDPMFVPDVAAPVDRPPMLDAILDRLAPLRGDMATVGENRLVEIVRDLIQAVRP